MDNFEVIIEVEEQATSTKKKKRILTSKENIEADLNELVLITGNLSSKFCFDILSFSSLLIDMTLPYFDLFCTCTLCLFDTTLSVYVFVYLYGCFLDYCNCIAG